MDKLIRRLYLIGFVLLALSLIYYQCFKGGYYLSRAKNNYIKVIPSSAIRGSIFDRNGLLLAYDRASFNIAIIPREIRYTHYFLFKKLAEVLPYDIEKIYKNYFKRSTNIFAPVDIIFDIDKTTALRLKEVFANNLIIHYQPQRYYPYPEQFSHLLGYVQSTLYYYDVLKEYGYSAFGRTGISGIEEYYDAYLRGEEGGELIEVDAKGKVVGFLGERKAERGKDITLTINQRMQVIAYETLHGKTGVIIIMDTQSGEILTLVSSPSFNLNNFIRGEDVAKVLHDKNNPMHNRALQSAYPLGSTFKPIVALASLEEAATTPATPFTCKGLININGAVFHCLEEHQTQDLYGALAHSCNIYFYNLGKLLGRDLMVKWARKFGFDSFSDIDLPYEKKGTLPISSFKFRRWFIGDTLNLSIGQGYIEVSPIEALIAINAFANGGYLIKPHLLKKVENIDSLLIRKNFIGGSSPNFGEVKKGLIEAVEREGATAHMLYDLNLKIAGKTGTAQTAKRPHSWFVGFFPYDSPKYSLCVFLEHGGSSHEALRVVHELLKRYKNEGLIEQ